LQWGQMISCMFVRPPFVCCRPIGYLVKRARLAYRARPFFLVLAQHERGVKR
jgi:hypothetical protein